MAYLSKVFDKDNFSDKPFKTRAYTFYDFYP